MYTALNSSFSKNVVNIKSSNVNRVSDYSIDGKILVWWHDAFAQIDMLELNWTFYRKSSPLQSILQSNDESVLVVRCVCCCCCCFWYASYNIMPPKRKRRRKKRKRKKEDFKFLETFVGYLYFRLCNRTTNIS